MPKILLFLLCLWTAVLSDVRIPHPEDPGFFDALGENPASRFSGLRLGLVWTHPMEGVDYETFGFFSEWGGSRYRIGASFASSFLDSLYRSENFGVEAALSFGKLSLGAGGNVDVQFVPGDFSWWRAVGRMGLSVYGEKGLSAGAFVSVPSDFERATFAGNVSFEIFGRFLSEAALVYREPVGFLFVFGEKIRLGALAFEGSFAYPGPKVGAGIVINLQKCGASFGMHRDGNYMDSRAYGLFFSPFSAKK